MLAFAIVDCIARGLVFFLPKVWRDRIYYNASEIQVFVVRTQSIKTKPRMTFVEAVFATILFDLALFGTDNGFINFIIRSFTKFQNSWDNKFRDSREAEKEILDFCHRLQIQHEPWIWEKSITQYTSLNDFFSRRYKEPLPVEKSSIVAPACSTISIHKNNDVFTRMVVKGCDYALEDVGLYPPEDLSQYAKHHVVLGYLSPTDYHRFHAPMSGTCIHCSMENAHDDSASVKFFEGHFNIMNKNKRLIVVLEDACKRRVALVIIGGIGVNTIVYDTTMLGKWIERGSEMGTFLAGGSAFCLFSNHPLTLDSKLLQVNKYDQDATDCKLQQQEVLVGESLANFSDNK